MKETTEREKATVSACIHTAVVSLSLLISVSLRIPLWASNRLEAPDCTHRLAIGSPGTTDHRHTQTDSTLACVCVCNTCLLLLCMSENVCRAHNYRILCDSMIQTTAVGCLPMPFI